ncbi:hypothetical protein LUZ60_012737 [Juncus effusus]|nr:hypothetical protein LUZ60_012737 [Juncus effusus]
MYSPSCSLTSNSPLIKAHHKPKYLPSLNPLKFTKRANKIVSACFRESGEWDPLADKVDQDMIILRKRIHEIKMDDMDKSQPLNWMEWEKDYYETSYVSDVCDFVGLLQIFLMNSRPSLAIGIILLIFLSLPTSLWFVLQHLMEASSSILSALKH